MTANHTNGAVCRIPLRRRDGTVVSHALIDACDAHLAELRWHLGRDGYAYRRTSRRDGNRMIALHRMVLGLTRGDGLEGDHRNGDRLDCRRENLRIGTRQLNVQNRNVVRGLSRFRGVSWHKPTAKWHARVMINYREHSVGYFHTELDAARAVDAFRREHLPFAQPDVELEKALAA